MADVSLAPLLPEHAPAMFEWMQDRTVRDNLMLRSEPSLERTLRYIEQASTDASVFARAIVSDGVHVGNVVLDSVDRFVGKARLHIYLGDGAARGKGIGKAALRLALAAAFGDLGLEKVYLTVHSENAAAIAAYEAVGFRKEGVHRGEFLLGGRRLEELYMGILRSEFRSG